MQWQPGLSIDYIGLHVCFTPSTFRLLAYMELHPKRNVLATFPELHEILLSAKCKPRLYANLSYCYRGIAAFP